VSSKNASFTVIEAARAFDGTSSESRNNLIVVIEDDTIRSIAPAGEVEIPATADTRRLCIPPGSTLVPGLIDTHTHLTMNGSGVPLPPSLEGNDGILLAQAAASARIHLHSGVTTVVDAGARGSIAFDLVASRRLGLIEAPRLIVAGRPITRTGGHAWPMGHEADGPADVRKAARQMLKEGADFIKIMATGGGTPGTYPHRPSYHLDELRVAAEEAHENGKLAVAHSSATEGHRRCLDAGIDIIYHGHFYEADGMLRFNADVARRLANEPVYVNPTLWVNGGRVEALAQKARSGRLTDDEQKALETRTTRYAGQRENVGRMAELGVRLIAGTDAGFALYPFGDLVTELEEMVACGISAASALQSATRMAAEALRIDATVGSLAPGKMADLLIVDGDPIGDISALRSVQAVVLGGEVIRNDGGLVASSSEARSANPK
jgi:imidazolonepropionase-like amidohydrolase